MLQHIRDYWTAYYYKLNDSIYLLRTNWLCPHTSLLWRKYVGDATPVRLWVYIVLFRTIISLVPLSYLILRRKWNFTCVFIKIIVRIWNVYYSKYGIYFCYFNQLLLYINTLLLCIICMLFMLCSLVLKLIWTLWSKYIHHTISPWKNCVYLTDGNTCPVEE